MTLQASRKFMIPATMALLCGAVISDAAVRIEIPEQGPGVPAYARIQQGGVIQDGTWVAIVFYRLPECVPPDFNLLSFFDAPRAFDCALTVRGFEIWRNGPPPLSADLGPIQTESRGLGAVPVWFVKWTELQTAIADGTLTISETRALPSLRIGTASFYQESFRPFGVAQHSSIEIAAHGLLSNGTAFQLHVAASPEADTGSVKIAFR